MVQNLISGEAYNLLSYCNLCRIELHLFTSISYRWCCTNWLWHKALGSRQQKNNMIKSYVALSIRCKLSLIVTQLFLLLNYSFLRCGPLCMILSVQLNNRIRSKVKQHDLRCIWNILLQRSRAIELTQMELYDGSIRVALLIDVGLVKVFFVVQVRHKGHINRPQAMYPTKHKK